MPGTRPTPARRRQRQQQEAHHRAAALARRAEAVAGGDPDRASFQVALGRLTNYQRHRYLRYGTPGDLGNLGYYAGLQRPVA